MINQPKEASQPNNFLPVKAQQVKAQQVKAKQVKAQQVKAKQGKAKQGKAKQGKAKQVKPRLFIVMGVSGSGKSSIASRLARELSFEFVEADNFHSEQAKNYMANNKPLSDEMRKPWIAAIIKKLSLLNEQGTSVVLAYSGLKTQHRNSFRALNFNCHYFYLSGDKKLILSRLVKRKLHFFSPDLLDSQFSAMEPAQGHEKDITTIDVNGSLSVIYQNIIKVVHQELAKDK